MKDVYSYDLFISYATKNKSIADLVVKKLEEKGVRCFIAPRDLQTGREYASEIVRGISNSLAVLLLFSGDSDKSAYVLREINSAVSRNKTIVPLRIENFLPSEAMEFYLGPTQWLDAFPEVLDTHLEKIAGIVAGLKSKAAPDTAPKEVVTEGPAVFTVPEMLAAGFTYRQITMRAIELDFMLISPEHAGDEEAERQEYEAWKGISEYSDAGCALVENDRMTGYCDFYPISAESFDSLMACREDVSVDMIDLYELGGTFDGYIAMMAIEPEKATQKKFMLLFDWVMRRIRSWQSDGIAIERIGAEAYSPLLCKILEKFGFTLAGVNGANGKIYQTTLSALLQVPYMRQKYGELFGEEAK